MTAGPVRELSRWSALRCSGPSGSREGLTRGSPIPRMTKDACERRRDADFSVETGAATWAVIGYFVAIAYKGCCLICRRRNF